MWMNGGGALIFGVCFAAESHEMLPAPVCGLFVGAVVS